MAYGENYIVFKLSDDGKVLFYPETSIILKSEEMQHVLEEIVPKVATYFEMLVEVLLGGKEVS